jgi:hypothetical protein
MCPTIAPVLAVALLCAGLLLHNWSTAWRRISQSSRHLVCNGLPPSKHGVMCLQAMQINECVNLYMSTMGGMERLYRQPIPFSYTRSA